ncbi:SLAP domain-containing protein [Bombilactobacillus bombi]|uniref:SLAP domain-containing protein n=1 Tax=Bombilactobacillus bombi TaxID=1303590 RepID=UPI0015E5C0BB|nr:SLAP domain-containing protein [Bombilactobacillus bombi]MBA1434284.1 hypothetical protein [Bombilactobacillus bombi]
MKNRSLMGVSVVAAALLAVAPIAAPAALLSSTQVVQAADTDDKDALQTALKHITDTFKDTTLPNLDGARFLDQIKPVSKESQIGVFDKNIAGSFQGEVPIFDKDGNFVIGSDGEPMTEVKKTALINDPLLSGIFQTGSKYKDYALSSKDIKAIEDNHVIFSSEISVNKGNGDKVILDPTQISKFDQAIEDIKDGTGTINLTYTFYTVDKSNNVVQVGQKTAQARYQAPSNMSKGLNFNILKSETEKAAKVNAPVSDYLGSSDYSDIQFFDPDDSSKDITEQAKGYITFDSNLVDEQGQPVTGDKLTKPGIYKRKVTVNLRDLMGQTGKASAPVYNYDKALADGKIIYNGKTLKDKTDNFDPQTGIFTYYRSVTVTDDKNKPANTDQDKNKPANTDQDKNKPANTDQDKNKPANTDQDKNKPANTDQDKNKPANTDQDKNKPANTDQDKNKPANTDQNKGNQSSDKDTNTEKNPAKVTEVSKDEQVNGVVTVNTGNVSSVAQLYDPQGRPIIDRALPAGSSWVTGYKHIIKGVAYYQVSTSEYVKADRVTFQDKSAPAITVGNISGAPIVSDIPFNVFWVRSAGYTALWKISNDRQSMIVKPDRFVAQNTPWATDKKAVINGQTFYRLSTNEWINSQYGSLER